MDREKGFTLIELVVVIIILGILAVIAAPKFINFSRDAKISALEGIGAAIVFAADETYLKAQIEGAAQARSSASNPPYVEIPAGIFELKYGYPEAWPESGLGILDMVELDDAINVCFGNGCDSSSNSSRVQIGYDLVLGQSLPSDSEACFFRYSEPGGTGGNSATRYTLTYFTDGC
ncbi:type II secretion system protein [Shewanella sp. KX20019]|uniref:type II secretion system protein n=1 Tax=Shewanella sp. KX20019 TaxID=2803864 RepID=UPI002351E09A|nr:type II secretion system protein [Shewanella sp. KX20019]